MDTGRSRFANNLLGTVSGPSAHAHTRTSRHPCADEMTSRYRAYLAAGLGLAMAWHATAAVTIDLLPLEPTEYPLEGPASAPTLLLDGAAAVGAVPAGTSQFYYYATAPNTTNFQFSIVVTPISGNPDVYAFVGAHTGDMPNPPSSQYLWSSTLQVRTFQDAEAACVLSCMHDGLDYVTAAKLRLGLR